MVLCIQSQLSSSFFLFFFLCKEKKEKKKKKKNSAYMYVGMISFVYIDTLRIFIELRQEEEKE